MKKYIVAGVFLIGGVYFVRKMITAENSKGNSFLQYDEKEKSEFFNKQKQTRMGIRNNPNLTPSQKVKEEEALNKANLQRYTQAERKAMAEYNINKLRNG